MKNLYRYISMFRYDFSIILFEKVDDSFIDACTSYITAIINSGFNDTSEELNAYCKFLNVFADYCDGDEHDDLSVLCYTNTVAYYVIKICCRDFSVIPNNDVLINYVYLTVRSILSKHPEIDSSKDELQIRRFLGECLAYVMQIMLKSGKLNKNK